MHTPHVQHNGTSCCRCTTCLICLTHPRAPPTLAANNPTSPRSTRGCTPLRTHGEHTGIVEDFTMWRSMGALIVILVLAILAASLTADATPAVNVRRIGILSHYAAPSEDELQQAQFTQGMHELGWREGQNITIARRYADGHVERLPEFAADLVRLGVEVIITHGTPATRVAMHATTTIPIVMSFTGFAVELGLVASL